MNTILVCDDERDIVSAIRIYLNGEGYRVLEAYSGVQALELMARERVDLVLMDIMMPEMDGLTAVAKIRETSNVPVLFLSAKSKAVTLDGEPVSLTPLEYSILRLLMETPGKVFSSDEIYQAVWNDAPYGANATVAVHIRHLREKLEIDPANPRYLKVLWGHGYKMEADNG